MIVISSSTIKMFVRASRLCLSFKDKLDGAKAAFYYENADGMVMERSVIDQFPWIHFINISKADGKGLSKIDSMPQFESARGSKNKKDRYFNVHARFWFRKIASVHACMEANKHETMFMWLDADCYAFKPILRNAKEIAQHGDIGYIKRSNMPTDTGIIFFNTANPAVRHFVNEWYNIYVSGRVFDLPCWADHYVFDHIMRSPEFAVKSGLKFFDLATCKPARGVVRHCIGHLQMAKLRERGAKT